MQQRRLRLGDILDDYCPRERRITNHAVVAMIEEQVKQTRCTTCDADHEYKQARVPARRKKDGPVLVADAAAPRVAAAALDIDDTVEDELLPADDFADQPSLDLADAAPETHAAAADDGDDADDPETVDEPAGEEDGPVHRRLIRATLPRPDGPSQEWKEPDFTVRQPGGNNPRGDRGSNFDGNRPGHRPGGHSRGPRRARPQGSGQSPHPRFGADRSGGPSRQGSGPPGHGGGNRPGRPGGHGPGHNRGPQQRPGGPGRKRGR